MAKVAVAPAVHSFSDLRPSSRALTITPRPASRKSTGFGTHDRPPSRNVSRVEGDLVVSPRRSKGVSSSALIITTGRRDSGLSLGKCSLSHVITSECFVALLLLFINYKRAGALKII